jgi:hypothetical protein
LEFLVGIIILVVLIVGGVVLFNNLRTSPTGARAARAIRSQIDTPRQTRQREPSLETLEPNDAIAFGDGGNGLVMSVLECSEQVGSRTTTWRWAFLDDGKLVEAGPEGRLLFEPPEIAYQGGETFQRLVADPDQGGVLKLFEQRVRTGSSATNPTYFEQAGQTFRLSSTGTFAARASGRPLGEVFRDISPQAGDNIYFEAEADNGDHLLGIWTTHIALLVGQPLGLTDVDAVYAGGEETA